MTITLNGTTGIQTPLGSAGSPVDSNTTTPTTGIYYPSATTWGVSTAGTNALYIDASQNVGIGTTSPGAILDVQSSAPVIRNTATTGTNQVAIRQGNTGGYFYTGIDTSTGGYLTGAAYAGFHWMSGAYPMIFATNNSERMRIDSSGNVGIGTTSPSSYGKLAVTGPIAVVGQAANAIQAFAVSGTTTSAAYGSFLNTSGSLYYGIENSVGGSIATGAAAYSAVLTTSTSTSLNLGTNSTVRATIDSSGNVGIGTTSPSSYAFNDPAPLVVANTAGSSTLSIASGATNFGQLAFANGTSGTARYNGYIKYDHSSNYMAFYTNAGTERMRIDSSGNLLVGKTSGSGNKVEVPGAGIAGQGTTNVSTSATTIFTISQTSTGAFIVVYGDDGSNGFMDILFFLANQTSQVISSKTMYGSPAARTYTTSTAALRAALASGSLNFRVAAISTLGT